MTDHWKKVGPVWKVLSLGLVAVLMAAAVSTGCDSELFDDQIWPIDETREECFGAPDSWRCNGEVAELCRNGWWNPWYNCAWNGGTCEEVLDENGEPLDPPEAGCVDPPEQEIVCETDIWDSSTAVLTVDPDTSDTDTGYDPDTEDTDTEEVVYDWIVWNVVEQPCMMCEEIPVYPEDFLDGPADADILDPLSDPSGWTVPNGPTDGVIGCCSITDSNAYWGVDNVVMQLCTNGCCAWIDYTSTIDSPTVIRHGCCPE